MAAPIERSFVPRVAVERTIKKGIDLYESVHGPADNATKERIKAFVIRQANILNVQGEIREDEFVDSPLYAGRKKPNEARNPTIIH